MELCAKDRLMDMKAVAWPENHPDKEQPLYQMVYEALYYVIISGQVRPGQHLTEYVLAQALMVSRTPVRAALIRLEKEGLVARKHGRMIVQNSLERTLREIVETRQALEKLAAAGACKNISVCDKEKLKKRNMEFAEALRSGNISASARADERFHEEISIIADNQVLLKTIRGLEGAVYGYRVRACSTSVDAERQIAEHNRIIEALCSKDSDKAERMVAMHIEGQQYILFDQKQEMRA